MKWPVATALIIVMTFVISIYFFSDNALYIRHVRQAINASKIFEARKDLLVASCPGTFEPSLCGFLQTRLKGQDLFDLTKFLKDYQKEFPEASYFDTRKLVTWLADDRIDKKLKGTEYESSASYAAYVAARENYLKKNLAQSKEDFVFIRGNSDIIAALKAMATHDGWVHLIGNMLIFALFAVFLEQRIGSFGLLLLYTLGGLGSNYLQLPFLSMGVRLFGASGAVSAVVGAFAVYFWQEKMRCLLSIGFVINRTLLVPAWLYIGLFMLLSDVIGMVGAGSSVAHLAHLTGFGIGIIFAFMQMDLFPLKKSFLFGQEQKLYYQAKESKLLEEKLVLYRSIYRLNRESFYAFRALFLYFQKQNFLFKNFKKEDQDFMAELIQSCFLFSEKRSEKFLLAREVLGLVPLTWNLSQIEWKVGPGVIIDKAEQFLGEGDLIQGLRFYDLFFAKFGAHPKAPDVQAVVMKIFDQIEKFEPDIKAKILEGLLLYEESHPDNHFQTQIRQLIHQVQREAQNAAG